MTAIPKKKKINYIAKWKKEQAEKKATAFHDGVADGSIKIHNIKTIDSATRKRLRLA